jgi:hypothetical protein
MAESQRWWQRLASAFTADTQKRQGIERPITLAEEYAATGSSPVYGDAGATLGPGPPPIPQPLDKTEQPRQWWYRPGWNIPSPPGEGRPLSANDLRELASANYLARRCIEVRKKEVIGLRWGIVPKEKNRKKSQQIQTKLAPMIDEITAFFMFPVGYPEKVNGKWTRKGLMAYEPWLDMLLEDHFVLDAMTVWPEVTLNGKLMSLRPIDGSTIKPLLTLTGATPAPPNAAFEQWLYGRPNMEFRADQLYYVPFNRRPYTPYGYSLVEQNLIQLNKVLRYEMFVSDYFTHGAWPDSGFEAPIEWQMEQVETAEAYLNARLSGNSKQRRMINIFPPGMKYINMKPFEFDANLDRAMQVETCLCFDVQPQEVGLLPEGNLGGKGASEGQETVTHRKSLRPLAEQLSTLFTGIIERYWGTTDLQFRYFGIDDDDEDAPEMDTKRLFGGQISLDQLLEEKGLDPVGVDQPFVVASPTMVLGIPDLKRLMEKGSGAFGSDEQDAQQAQNGTQSPNGGNPPLKDGQPPSAKGDETDDTKKSAALDTPQLPANIANTDPNQPSDDPSVDLAEVEAEIEKQRKSHEIELWFAKEFLKRFKKRKFELRGANTAQAIATRMAYTPEEVQELGKMIGDLKIGAYTAGVNTAFEKASYPLIDTIKDPLLKHDLTNEAIHSASEIAQTFQKDAQDAAQSFLDLGMKPLSDDMVEAMEAWQEKRAEWKSEQIAKTEGAQPFVKGTVDAVNRNGWKVKGWNVTPEQCKCERCQELVDSNPWTPEYGVLLALWLPLHPNCIHAVEPIWEAPPTEPIWTGGE